MSYRKTPLVNNEIYHIYNRGVDKRDIFLSKNNIQYFMDGLKEFNGLEPIGSLYLKNSNKERDSSKSKDSQLVNIIAYCLNSNHFHLILQQNTDKGIEKFMQKLCTSYAKRFNYENNRNGSLFQGKFKSKHIDSNAYLLYLSAYVNLNDKIHNINNEDKKVFSSLKEYTEEIEGICEKSIVLDQYKNKEIYKKSLENLLPELIKKKEEMKDLEGDNPKQKFQRSLASQENN